MPDVNFDLSKFMGYLTKLQGCKNPMIRSSLIRPLIITVVIVYTAVLNLYADTPVARSAIAPEKIIASKNGKTLYFTERLTKKIAVYNLADQKVSDLISLTSEPTGLALAPDGAFLYVTCSSPENILYCIDTAEKKVAFHIPARAGACCPVINDDARTIYVCNQFENSVSVIDIEQKKEISTLPADHEPNSAILIDHQLIVANRLPSGPSTAETIAAGLDIFDTQTGQRTATILLPNGSTFVQDLCSSPSGKHVFITHLLSHYSLPTTQLDRGWMINNAISVIDPIQKKYICTFFLDDIGHGAANPWAVACSPDGKFLCATHAGTHEISRIDLPSLLEKIQTKKEETTKLGFINPIRQRISLQGKGPRGLVVLGQIAYITNYFTDNLNLVDLSAGKTDSVRYIPLALSSSSDPKQLGEMLFHDASICYQGWQSCASCHPDGRADGLNWDLLNDGLGNPKNTKSLLHAFDTPPSMSAGIRENAQQAVRSGIKNILYSQPKEQDVLAIEKYLRSLVPVQSPILLDNSKHASIQGGKDLFFNPVIGCAKCHNGEFYTDMKSYDVGTANPSDSHEKFDTPTLLELWRTAPYLHDGSAATVRDVLKSRNAFDRHGKTSHLTDEEIKNLEFFLLSL